MPFFMITLMTVFAIIAFVWLIASSQHTNLYSLRNLFLAAWLYYGFAVGVDLITGAEIPYTPNEANMMDPSSWGSIAFVMWNYVLCGVAFLVTYLVMQGDQEIRPTDLKYSLRTPPDWLLITVHVAIGFLYVQTFFGMARMERFAIAHESPTHKFLTLLVPIALAMDILVILSSKERKAAIIAVGCGILLALLTGDRTYVMLVCLCSVYHWRPALRGWKLVGIVVCCIAMMFTLKTVYAVGIAWFMGNRVSLDMIYEHVYLSLTRLDAGASYLISIFYTEQESPLWLGKSYIKTTLLLAWPRFLGGMHVSTLGEDYIWTYHYADAQRGGGMAFSAMAEAWLNFGYFGAILLGSFWGAVANWFDRRPRGVTFFVVLLMISRLFRTDAASLLKTWVIVWGTVFVLALTVLTIYTVVTAPTNQLNGPSVQPKTYQKNRSGLGGSMR